MTVSTTTVRATYVGNGLTTVFPFSFRVNAATDIKVYTYDSVTNVYAPMNAASYTVSVNEDRTGGSVTVSGTPLAATVTIYIARETPYVQPILLENQTRYFPDVVMEGFDLLAMQIQQVEDEVGRKLGWNPVDGTEFTFEDIQELYDGTVEAAARAETAADRVDSVNVVGVNSRTDLAAVNTSLTKVGFVFGALMAAPYLWDATSRATEISANDPRYAASAASPSGAAGAWVQAGSVWDGHYSRLQGHVPQRNAGRAFNGASSTFGGEWTSNAGLTGLNPLARAIHGWAFRDGGWIYDDHAGSMAIVGHSQSSREAEWPGSPSFNPAAIGVSGFAINDAPAGFNGAWGVYGDAVRLNSGFTVGAEFTMANASTEGVSPNPFNMKSGGAQGGITAWLASGGGLDVAWTEYDRVKHSSAYVAMLTSFRDTGGTVAWENGQAYIVGRAANDGETAYVCLVPHTAPATGTFAAYRTANPTHWQVRKSGAWAALTYVVGDLATDTVSGNTFICAAPHTASGSVFSTYRQANPTHWRQNPGAKAGIIAARGAVAESIPGADLYPVMDMPDRHQIRWWRDNTSVPEVSAFIWNDRAADGSASVGITFRQNLVDFTATNGIRADALRVGGTTTFATVTRASGANDSLVFTNPGTGVILFSVAGAESGRFDSAGLNLASGNVIRINGVPVVGPRDTGWAAPTGATSKATFDPATVTLVQLAQRVASLINAGLAAGSLGA